MDHSSNIHAIHADLRTILDGLVTRQQEFESLKSPKMRNHICQKSNSTICKPEENTSTLPLPTIITIYLLPEAIQMIETQLIKLMKLSSNLRLVCNTWGLSEIKPIQTVDAIDVETRNSTKLFLYTHESVKNHS
mmetsp:Transcript_14174/g.20244  ORF Transcript_14174/g.20244 Transcript_14174/m.20244 type:complete len:134 (+) Transcript_14174:539-940(+)